VKIVSQSNRLVDMVSEILDVSKLESDEMPLELGSLNLTALCHELSEEWAEIPEKQLDLETTPGLIIQADGELLSRVLSNLLSNAFKYTPVDKPVLLRLLKNDGEVEVQVVDHGPGVPDEYKEKIFEKFGQVAGTEHKRAQSSGLGLTFCQLVVTKHGGTIGVRDGLNGGSVFWFRLPVYQ
jgi:signal transduction histidine kinase